MLTFLKNFNNISYAMTELATPEQARVGVKTSNEVGFFSRIRVEQRT